VDYDAASGIHKVVWYGEWRFSELRLAGISNPQEGVHGARMVAEGRPSQAGKRIILQPSNAHFIQREGNAQAGDDFRACVLKRAEGFPRGSGNDYYHIFYLEHQLIVTANLAQVRYEIIDNKTNDVKELRNADMARVELDEPLRMTPADDYVGTGPIFELIQGF